MESIYIGVCKTRDDERFNKSFREFTDSICREYSVCQMIIKDKFLPDAQNIITRNFLQSDYDYLLLLDDDHCGHTKDMLECLIKADTFVATMKTYCRKYPYMVAAWDRVGAGAMVPIEVAEGYRTCDLTGFPMTLISRETFSFLEEPYFRPCEGDGRNWNSDIDFFDRLAKVHIRPVVCFQHTLNHDKITADNVHEYRIKEREEGNNIAWFRILQEQEQLQGA